MVLLGFLPSFPSIQIALESASELNMHSIRAQGRVFLAVAAAGVIH